MRRFASVIFALFFAFAPLSASAQPLPYYAEAVTVMCARTGIVVYEYNAHRRHYPASLVKVMTALLVLEQVEDLHALVTMSETAATLPYYAAHMGLVAGDVMTVLQALYGIMLPSANEVANALAEHVAGSLPAFVAMMNERAYELGAYNTRFVNACGLPGHGQFITAYDMSLIMREAVTHPVFLEIINTAYFDFPPSYRFPEGRPIRNTNRLVRPADELFNPWIVGGKTGWIIAARNTLSTYATMGGRALIVTVLYTYYRVNTFTDTTLLMHYGFRQLEYVPLPVAYVPYDPYAYDVYYVYEGYDVYDVPYVYYVCYDAYMPDDPVLNEPLPAPWETLGRFALNIGLVFALITLVACGGFILFGRNKKWTSYSETSQR